MHCQLTACSHICRNFHSTASFPCPSHNYDVYPAGKHPLLTSQHIAAPRNLTTVSLLLDNMTRVLAIDHKKYQIRVQAGMFATQLLAEAAKANMSCPLGAIPAFGDLTLGGVLVTGAHGSGHKTTSSVVSKHLTDSCCPTSCGLRHRAQAQLTLAQHIGISSR